VNVDTDNDADTNSASTTTDSSVNGTGQPDNQSADTTDVATSTADESANADNQGGAASGSLTDRAEQHQNSPNSAAGSGTANPKQDFVPRKDYAALQGEFTRRSQRIKEMEKERAQYDGIKPEDVRAWKAAQETAQKSSLPRWSPTHPEHERFKGLRERYQFAKSLIDRAKPEDREARKAELAANFHPDELKTLEDWKAHEADFTSRLASDPEGTLSQMMDQRIAQANEQREQRAQHQQKVDTAVGGWFDDPSNRMVIQSQKEFMQGALAEGIPWAVVRREATIRHLMSERESGQRTVQSAEEKERLLRGNASVSRDANTRSQPAGDLYDRAKKIARDRGIPPGDGRFMNILDELQAQE
jgi:hypothetical protein